MAAQNTVVVADQGGRDNVYAVGFVRSDEMGDAWVVEPVWRDPWGSPTSSNKRRL